MKYPSFISFESSINDTVNVSHYSRIGLSTYENNYELVVQNTEIINNRRTIFYAEEKFYYITIYSIGYSSNEPLNISIKSIEYLSSKIENSDLKVNNYTIDLLDSVYINTDSLAMNTDETNNIAIGKSAMRNSDSTRSVIAIGVGAFTFGKGYSNIAIGNNALVATNCNVCIGIGHNSLVNCKQGLCNIALGNDALSQLKVGSSNIAIGFYAMRSGTYNVENNIAIGYYAGTNLNNPTSKNICIGNESMRLAKSASNSIVIGYSAARVTTSANNVIIGNNSVDKAETASNNVLIGYEAFNTYSTSGSVSNVKSCVAIGYGTKLNTNIGTNQIVIGFKATGRGDNSIVLGDLNINKLYCRVTSISINSDIRLKEEIEPANIDMCLQSVKDLPVKRYKYKNFMGKYNDVHVTGWIADDVEKIFPKCVGKSDIYLPVLDENGDQVYEEIEKDGEIIKQEKTFLMKNVKDITMTEAVPTLWGAVQCLSDKIDKMQLLLKDVIEKEK